MVPARTIRYEPAGLVRAYRAIARWTPSVNAFTHPLDRFAVPAGIGLP